MALIIGGSETGILNSSLNILNRNDWSDNNTLGHGAQLYANVVNGNLLLQEQDAFMPSLGDDYALVRTYNARGRASDAHQHEDARWTFSTSIRLDVKHDNGEQYFEVEYGDGTFYDYRLDASTGLYVSTDGAGAFETIEDLGTVGNDQPSYLLTRADQTRLSFDSQGRLLKIEDTNGVTVDYVYESDRLVQVLDDQGHVINYVYDNGVLYQVTDETEGVLVEYHYDSGLLSEVIDRYGHSTQYFYTNDGFLERVVFPYEQVVDGQTETYANRELNFIYDTVNWRGNSQANAMVVTQIIDAEGNTTTFEYDFEFSQGATSGKKLGHLKNGKVDDTSDIVVTDDDKFFEGGTTTMVDALGNNRAYSNDAEYVQWRTANGYYGTYDAAQAASDPGYQAQVDAIRNAHAMTYTYRDDGNITEVVDQQGFHTLYAYDAQDNLISVTDRNGWGATHSDSDYFRRLRAELGVVDAAGNGKLVADLNSQEMDALTEAFTSHFEYDSRGNLTRSMDNADNEATFVYTDFNKLASTTSAVGHALVTRNDQLYQDKRVELGYAALVEDLSAADTQAILDLYTTYFDYDANQNLIERRDAGGDITRFEYDSFGNLIRRIVFLDANDLADPAKQQITTYAYDGFGNNISSTDAEGYQSFSEYDHFGNLTRFTDANGGVTNFTYDKDNRLLTVTDPEGHTTVNTYDAVGNRISVTDAAGHTVTRVYNLNNNLIATVDPSESDPLQDRTTSFEYDVVGNNTAVVDAEGRRTEYSFSTRRELVEVLTTEVEDENGNPVRYLSTVAYDGEGNRISTTNNRGFTTEILYTSNNLIRQQTDANGHITRFEYDADNNHVRIIAGYQLPPEKRQILQFSYDEEDQLTIQTDALGNVTTFAYDAPGNRVAATDANGHTTEFAYDGNNRLIREILPEVIDPLTGQPVRYTIEHHYDGNGNEIETIDANGHSTKYTFDRDDLLTMVEDANGIKTVFSYDSRHNHTAVMIGVEATADADGHITVGNVDQAQTARFAYDEFNQLIAQTDGVGNALAESDAALYQQLRQELGYAALVADLTAADQQALRELYTRHFTYDKVGNQLSRIDHLDRTTTFSYDGLNRLTSTTDAAGGITRLRYDGNGNQVARTDAEGRVSTFAYDSVDRLTDSIDPLGVNTHRTYDDFGNLLSETRAFGTAQARTTTYAYDLNNRLIAQLDPEGHNQSFEYDAVGNRIRVVDGRGNAFQYLYDALNRNVKIIDPLTFETRFEYDGVGNRISLIDARGGITRFEYDPGNRQIRTTDAEGRVITYAYDVRGNRIEQHTAAGTADEEITLFEYDAGNNLRRVTDAEGGVSENDYDRVYNRIETVDANGHSTISEFDALNRIVRITDAEGQVTQFSYDAVGNRLTQTDALGRITTFEYDANDRAIRQTTADGVDTTYSYDLVGNRTTITRAANTADAATDTFVYNLDDRLIEQIDAEGNSTVFAYDENHNRTHVTDANGNTTVYTYDANNRVTHIQDPEGNVVQYTYDGNGNRTQVIDGRGSISTSYYNANNEVTLSADAEGYATGFIYDNNGNVVSQTLYMQALALPLDPAVEPAPAAGGSDQTIQFEYDKLNRVTGRIDAEGFRTEFAYDAVGNRLQTRQYRDLAGSDIAVTHSYYDDVNRETARVTAEGYLTRFTYDAVGNRTSRTLYDQPITPPAGGDPAPAAGDSGRTHTMAYDQVNRLVRETSPLGVHTDHEYDARGNRTATVEAATTADERRTTFAYDRADRLVDTTDALGTVTHRVLDGNGNVVQQHDAYGTDDVRISTAVYDGNNRVISRTDALGVATTTVYDANGNVIRRTRADGLADARTETFEYDRNNRMTAQVNGEGERTESAYDGAGNRIRLTLAPGLTEERTNLFEFDRDNRLAAAIDGEGVRTEYRYDGAGNKLETIQAAGVAGQERHSFYVYDLDNRLTRITDPLGGVTQYTYDVLGNQTQIVNANGGVQTNTFDILGRMLTSLSAGDILTANTYDLRGNILSTTQSFGDGSDSRTTTYAYDLLDRQVRVTDAEGFSTTIEYDPFGNQTRVTHGQYLLQPGDAGYDADKAARAFEQSNTFTYDAADRMLSLTDGEGNLTTYGYDAVGNRTSITEAADSAPRTTTYAYDLADRLVRTVTPEGGIAENRYDETGNRIEEKLLQSDDGTTQVWITKGFEYDGNARMTAEIDPYGVRTEFDYDAMGNRTVVRRAAGTADERITRSEYDLNNRVSAGIDGEGNRTEFAYDAMGNRIKATDALGRVARFYFDGGNNLVAVLDAQGYINTFSYDAAGNRTGETIYMTAYSGPVDDFVPPAATPSAQDRIFTSVYDGNSRIIQRTQADGSRTIYAYDGAGNLLREVQFANTAAPRELLYGYDLNNRLTQFTDVDGTVTTFAYDGANNKISQTITNAADPNAVRTTTFAYDLNNRQIAETFDPGGLNLVQTTAYDKVGNVIAQTDANGHTSHVEYDLNNRVVRKIDALGNDTVNVYDAVGNQVAFTDANGHTSNFVYDANNRVVQEILPEVEIYTMEGGFETLRPTIARNCDAAGNEVQIVDAAGYVTTRYYDSNNRMTAEINGDNVLREWTYNAAGEQMTETLFMTRLTAAAHDPALRPAPPAGDSRTVTTEFDLAGRTTRIIYPAIEITTLAGTETDNPTATTVVIQPEQTFVYDAFGNQIESVDRNGSRTVTYYDAKNRIVAQVDPEGYLTEFDYDAQDNVVEQRIYTQSLDMATVDAATRPAPPAGDVYQTNRSYDAASRLIEERSPLVEVFDPATLTTVLDRVITQYGYDAVGNQTSRTLAAGTSQQYTEYSYFDALNRQVVVIDGNRVVNLLGFDANGNQTLAKRFFNTVDAGVDLTTLTGATNFAALVGADENDQQISRLYDALDQMSSETHLMGAGSADDLIQSFGYDTAGNRTRAVDEDGFVQQFSFDALNNMLKSMSPDGSGTTYEYDAAGNQIYAFTGQLDSIPVPATNLSAALGADLTIAWSLPAGANVQSYVVYDTVSRTDIDSYANQSAVQGTWLSQSGSAAIPTDGLSAGESLYFRVVTQDIAGSITWSAEQQVTLPPRLTAVAVRQTGPDSMAVSGTFESGATLPQLLYGMPGATNTAVDMVDQGGGVFSATLTGITNLQELAYRVTWQDGGGNSYGSGELPFEAQGGHAGVSAALSESTVMVGSDTFYKAHVDATIADGIADGLMALAATWQRTDVADGARGSASVEGADSGLGYSTYNLVLGTDSAPLEAGTYSVTLRGVGETEDIILDTFEITVGSGTLSGTRRSLSWTIPDLGDDQVVIVNGLRVSAGRQDSRLVVDPQLGGPGSVDYSAYYGSAMADDHTTTVTSTEITQIDYDDSTTPPTEIITVLGYDLGVSTALSAAEAALVAGDVHLAWRPAGSGTAFANDVVMTASGTIFDATLPLLAAGQYDLKVYYMDAAGSEVVVDWLRADTAEASADVTGRSVTIQAGETDGAITLGTDETLAVDPGLFSGPVGAILDSLTLSTTPTGNAGDSRKVDGSTTGYYTENQYNALNARIATNAETGIWRQFGVDANGNAVVVYDYGLDRAGDPITTFTAYDGRNREIARFGVQTADGRAVTRLAYDGQDNIVRESDVRDPALATTRTFNALGSQLTETLADGSALARTTTYRYDRLGRQTAEIDALNIAQYKHYDTVGNLIQQVDGEGHATDYTYDVFGRRTAVTNALGQSVGMQYDQRDRLVQTTDGMGGVTAYAYDGRDNRTQTIDANGHEFRQEFDGLGRVMDTVSYQNSTEIHERSQYDAYGNLVASIDGEGRITTKVYGEFGRQVQEVDSGGRITYYEYDDQGRMIREWRPASGKDIRRNYDDAGRLTEVNDLGTGVRTVFTYDLAGNRLSELTTTTDNAHNRTVSYQYDAIGQITRWADAVTGLHTNYMWDGAGNLYRAYTDTGYDPQGENTDFNQVLTAIEAVLDQVSYEVEHSDGETTWTETVYPYQGTHEFMLRARAQDLGIDLTDYDRVFRSRQDQITDGEDTYYGPAHWTESVLDHKAALRQLLEEMAPLEDLMDIGAELDAAVIDPAYRFVDHVYSYNGNHQIAQMTQRGAMETQYSYDAAGNRVMVNNKGTLVDYFFDANGRVIRAESNGVTTMDWQYDDVGNVTRFRTFKSDGSVDKTTTKQYYENNRNYYTNDAGQQTTQTLDLTGRTTRTVLVDDGNSFTFDHIYDAYGREVRINARGKDAGGATVNSYDVNDKLVTSNKGQGDTQERPEYLTFVYNNDNQILYRFHDTGEGRGDVTTSGIFGSGGFIGYEGEIPTETEYAYANSNPVGETGNDVNGDVQTQLDTGSYNLVQQLGKDYPGSSVTFYTVRQGDTLQSIAAAVYGNPSLWFVLAEANGIEAGTALTEGQQLQIPNTIKTGRLTAETHKIYDESEIIGSTLPNIKSDPPDDDGCGSFLMIVIIVVIAVVAAIATAGLAGVLLAAAGASGLGATVVAYAVAGAIVGALASVVQQGLFIALGYQDEFSWSAVASGAVAGALSGAAQGIGAGIKAAQAAGEVVKNVQYMKVAAAALKVASAASKQLIENGQITSWTSLAAAGVGGYLETGRASEIGKLAHANKVSTDVAEAGLKSGDIIASDALQSINTIETAVEYITPWVEMAETYVRNDGELTPTDWANAVGSTLSTAINKSGLGKTEIENAVLRTAGNMMVAGALSGFDKNAAQAYLENAVGNEVGQLIGQELGQALDHRLKSLANSIEQNRIADNLTLLGAGIDRDQGQVQGQELTAPMSGEDQNAPGVLDILEQMGAEPASFGTTASTTSDTGELAALLTPEQRSLAAKNISTQVHHMLKNDPDALLQKLTSARDMLASGQGDINLLNEYLTVLVAMGGTDPGGDYRNISGSDIGLVADYALSSSIGDLYIKSAVKDTLKTGNQNLQIMLLSRDAKGDLGKALMTKGSLNTGSGGYGRIGDITQASITEEDLRNSSILRPIYQGGVPFKDGSAAAQVTIAIDGVEKTIDFRSDFAWSMVDSNIRGTQANPPTNPSSNTLSAMRQANRESMRGVRPDTYVALLKAMYNDSSITGVELVGGVRPISAGGAHPYGRALDISQLFVNRQGTTSSIPLSNSGWTIANGPNQTLQGTPISPFGGNNLDQQTANSFINNLNLYGGTGVNQIIGPNDAIPGLTVGTNRIGSNVQYSDLTTKRQRTIWKHDNHIHFGVKYYNKPGAVDKYRTSFRPRQQSMQQWVNVRQLGNQNRLPVGMIAI